MKEVTKAKFEEMSKHGYTEVKEDGTPYMLWLDKGGTVWGPVKIVDQLTESLVAEPMYPEALMPAHINARPKNPEDAQTCGFCGRSGILCQSVYQDRWFCGECYPDVYQYALYFAAFDKSDPAIVPLTFEHWKEARDKDEAQGAIHAAAMRLLDN